jgi:hypothetical protein
MPACARFAMYYKVDGAMYRMVYAPYGRTGVYMLQDYCRGLRIGTSGQEIGDLVATLESLPPHHPLVTLLRESRDAGNADALADALLNPNKSHAYHDLILVLSAEDKRLFDAVDGRRSIADIAERASGDHRRVRALVEKLWWYDQVVFDTSRAG